MEKNIYEAIKWYEKAAKMGNPEAQFCLARLMYEDALHWFDVGIEYPDTLPYIEENATKMLEILEKHKKKAEKKRKTEQKQSTLSEKYANLKVGDTIQFGMYPQKSADSSDKSPIEWIVLAIEDGKALLHSKYGLFARAFNDEYVNITWEKCTLRKYLNSEFYNTAFSEAEKKLIVKSTVKAHKNPDYKTNPGNDTEDNVFLLSVVEAKNYLKDDDARMRYATEYAKKTGTSVSKGGRCWWWLRSPGYYSGNTTYVYSVGSLHFIGDSVSNDHGAVCPALLLDIKS